MPGSILAAIDFSPVSDRVVEEAARLGLALEAELTLLHAAAPDPDFVGYEVGPQHVRDNRAHELQDEHRQLHVLAGGLRDRGLTVRARLHAGPTADVILAEAEARSATLIVVGSHRHSRTVKLLLGSTSEAVLRKAACPVLVVPPVEQDEPRLAP
jgi:nucleotide-binding universal stress UspA family protein